MKKIIFALVALVMVSSNALACMSTHVTGKKMPTRFQAVCIDDVKILQEGESKMYCPKCGMTLPTFYKTNHAADVDGKSKQYCSMHCLAEAIADGSKVTDVKVVDNTTLEFTDVIKTWYVFGSSKPGTMSMTSKYAFGKKSDAEKFAKKFGGQVMTYYAVLDSVKSTLVKESAKVQKKQDMMAQKGHLMYTKTCISVDANFTSTAEAKAYLITKKPCGEISDTQLQAIGIYLYSRDK